MPAGAAGCGGAGPRPDLGKPFGDVETYREVADRSIEWGGAMDRAMLYFDVRLAESYPTVELRVADVCLEVEDAVLVAVLARALVETHAGEAAQPWRTDLLNVAAWRAARYGIAAISCTPGRASWRRPGRSSRSLLEHVGPAVDATGERRFVEDGFERLLSRGTAPSGSAGPSRRPTTWWPSSTTSPTRPRRPGCDRSAVTGRSGDRGLRCGRRPGAAAGPRPSGPSRCGRWCGPGSSGRAGPRRGAGPAPAPR